MDITLLPEFRGRSFGGETLSGLVAEATAAAKPLTIGVEKYKPAMRLHRRLGFGPVANRDHYDLLEWRPGSSAPLPQLNTAS
jgi:hypothetical protein